MYILLKDSATGAVNACFLIHLDRRDPYANSSFHSRYLTFVASIIENGVWSVYMASISPCYFRVRSPRAFVN